MNSGPRHLTIITPNGVALQHFVPKPLTSLLREVSGNEIESGIPRTSTATFCSLLPALAHDSLASRDYSWFRALAHNLSKRNVSIRTLIKLNSRLRGLKESNARAGVRSTAAWVGGPDPLRAYYVPPPSEFLAKYLSEFVEIFNGRKRCLNFAEIAVIFAWFLLVHPFEDGNGRTARLILATLCISSGFVHPAIILNMLWVYRNDAIPLTGALQAICTRNDWISFFDLWAEGFIAVRDLSAQVDDPAFLSQVSMGEVVQLVRQYDPATPTLGQAGLQELSRT